MACFRFRETARSSSRSSAALVVAVTGNASGEHASTALPLLVVDIALNGVMVWLASSCGREMPSRGIRSPGAADELCKNAVAARNLDDMGCASTRVAWFSAISTFVRSAVSCHGRCGRHGCRIDQNSSERRQWVSVVLCERRQEAHTSSATPWVPAKDWALEYGLAFSAAYCHGCGRLKTGAIFTWGYAKPLVKYPPHGL